MISDFGLPLLILLVCAEALFAWKPKTHIYLAQQVLNEVYACDSVTIYGSNDSAIGRFAVEHNTLMAIKIYPAQFRAGAIGPDGYPDILTGQMLIHPRDPGTYRWLKYLRNLTRSSSGSDRAFVAGYFTHAAGDLFGHTFINHFAGGPFELGINAVKHTVVESYLDNHLPPTLTMSGAPLAESDVSIGNGIDKFIHDNMVVATPGSELDVNLLTGQRGKFSVPRVFSSLRNSLQSSISGYYARVSEYGRQYDATVAAAQACGWLDFSCSKTALYTKAGIIAGEKAAYRVVNGPIITYKEHWRDDIDAGLLAWPALSHEMALSLFGTGPTDIGRAQTACGNYVLDHLLSMAGAPDAFGHTIAFILDVLKAIMPQFIIDAIDVMKKDLFNFLLTNTIGMTTDETKEYFSNPGLYFGPLGLDLASYKTNELLFTATDSTVHYMNVPPAFNTVNMIKMSLLDSSETVRLFQAIGADTTVKLADGAIMAGEWFWSLDESRQWTNGKSKALRMALANDTAAFYRIFKHQTGENDDFPSPFADSSLADTTAAGALSLLPNGFTWGNLSSRQNKFTSFQSVTIPADGRLEVYAVPVEASLRPVELALEFNNGWLIASDESRQGVAHVSSSNLRAGTYLIEVDGEMGNVCDNEYSFDPNYWPPDPSCNLWGGFGKYVVWCRFYGSEITDVEPDNNVQSAVQIPLDSTVWRTLGYRGLNSQGNPLADITDVMRFRLPSGGDAVIEFAADSMLYNATVEIYDSLGDFFGNGTGRFQSILLAGLDTRTYYIETGFGLDTTFGGYSIAVRTLPAFSADAEPNDIAGSGSALMPNVPARGRLGQSDTVDWYTISTDSAATISVTLIGDSAFHPDLAVFAENGAGPIGTDSCQQARCMASWTAAGNTVFYLKVTTHGSSGTYQLVAEGAKKVSHIIREAAPSLKTKSPIITIIGGRIKISLPAGCSGPAVVKLIDMKGRATEVWRGTALPGENSIYCSAKGLCSGFFFISIEAQGFHKTAKIAVVR